MEQGIILGVAVSSLFFCIVTVILSLLAYAKVVAMEKSTHKIQYMPAPVPNQVEEGGIPNPTGMDLVKRFAPHDEEF